MLMDFAIMLLLIELLHAGTVLFMCVLGGVGRSHDYRGIIMLNASGPPPNPVTP
jgi:hypothetical protein